MYMYLYMVLHHIASWKRNLFTMYIYVHRDIFMYMKIKPTAPVLKAGHPGVS